MTVGSKGWELQITNKQTRKNKLLIEVKSTSKAQRLESALPSYITS